MHNILKSRTDQNFLVLTFLRFVLKKKKFKFLTCSDTSLIKFYISHPTMGLGCSLFCRATRSFLSEKGLFILSNFPVSSSQDTKKICGGGYLTSTTSKAISRHLVLRSLAAFCLHSSASLVSKYCAPFVAEFL